MSVLAFIDLLGLKDLWARKGINGARRAFDSFRKMVLRALEGPALTPSVRGAIESDAVALVFPDVDSALKFSVALYRQAFLRWNDRWWLRGVITTHPEGDALRVGIPLTTFPDITDFIHSYDLLRAIGIEKAGFRGMRLLIESVLLSSEVVTRFTMPIQAQPFVPFRRLEHSAYPELVEGFQDVLWQISAEPDVSKKLDLMMKSRLRRSAKSPDEFIQAAATQVVFHECESMLISLCGTEDIWG